MNFNPNTLTTTNAYNQDSNENNVNYWPVIIMSWVTVGCLLIYPFVNKLRDSSKKVVLEQKQSISNKSIFFKPASNDKYKIKYYDRFKNVYRSTKVTRILNTNEVFLKRSLTSICEEAFCQESNSKRQVESFFLKKTL